MKNIYRSILIITIVFVSSLNGVAQVINRLQITSPESIAGDYEVVSAAFGNTAMQSVTGELKLIEDNLEPTSDGCTEAVNSLTGYIALIDRGTCPFVDKARSAQNAGAIAMVVCQNVEGEDAFIMGGDAPDITIPCVMATYEDCQMIRVELQTGIQVMVDFYDFPCIAECAVFDFPETTVWGQNGEGAFACGLGDWAVEAISDETSVWKWDADTSPVGQSGAPRAVESVTECNGAAQMDFCNYNFNSVNGPSTEIYYQSNLISPIIDLSNVESPVIRFEQYLCTLYENQEIAFFTQSIDGGTTWLDTIPITSPFYIPTNGFLSFDGRQILKFPIHGNTSECLIKFIANGNFYFWTIDDVYITDEPMVNFSIDESSLSGAPNFKTPKSQIDKVPFMVTVMNEGNVDMIDVKYTATITKDGSELYSTTQELGNVLKLSSLDNMVAPEFWEMVPESGEYQITYTLDAANIFDDPDLEDNTVTSTFVITEGTFSKLRSEEEANASYMIGLGQDATHLSYANGYYITNGKGLAPYHMTTGFSTDIYTDFGFTTLTGEVREWLVDSNEDGIVNLATETTLLAQGQILLDPNNPIDLRNIDIELSGGSAFTSEFKSTGHYLAVVHVAPLSPPSQETRIAPLSSGIVNGVYGNQDYNFAPTDFAFTELEGGLGRPTSFSDFTGTESTPSDQGSRNLSPEPSLSWHISIEIKDAPYNPSMNTVDINNNIDISIFPNPTSQSFALDLSLVEVSKAVKVEVVDTKGQVVANHHFTHIKDDILEINTTALTSGVYMVNVFTDTGVNSERILIQK